MCRPIALATNTLHLVADQITAAIDGAVHRPDRRRRQGGLRRRASHRSGCSRPDYTDGAATSTRPARRQLGVSTCWSPTRTDRADGAPRHLRRAGARRRQPLHRAPPIWRSSTGCVARGAAGGASRPAPRSGCSLRPTATRPCRCSTPTTAALRGALRLHRLRHARTPEPADRMSTHTLSVLVENKPGVLARVSGPVQPPRLQHRARSRSARPSTRRSRASRSWSRVEGAALEQVTKQLNKLDQRPQDRRARREAVGAARTAAGQGARRRHQPPRRARDRRAVQGQGLPTSAPRPSPSS